MRVLQAQIKPHFLFNTLESINVLAVQNEGRKVSEMVYRLASILRISIQEKEEITLEEEIKHLQSYLEIQKFRFEDLFEYEIDVPKELMHSRILKLTLQPLVENSIQHGFEGISYTGWIRISAWKELGNVMIRVEDNGLGMTSEQLSVFEYMVSEDNGSEQTKMQNLKVNQERRGLDCGAWLTGFAFSTGIITVYSYAQAAPAAPLYNASYPIMTGEGQHVEGIIS